MKDIKWIVFSVALCFMSCGTDDDASSTTIVTNTPIESVCTDSTNTLQTEELLQKAQLIAVKYTLEENTNWTDSARISDALVDDVLSVFYAIQNAEGLIKKTESLALDIIPYPSLNQIILYLDNTSELAIDWSDDDLQNDVVSDLLTQYGLVVISYEENHPTGHKVVLETNESYNTEFILNRFLEIKGVITGNNEQSSTIIDNVSFSSTDSTKTLTFTDRTIGGGESRWYYEVDESCIIQYNK
ncbi:MAG: hypothetical protein GY827_07675 [Cytophagales bacterium]|nr:hypothetical protein [Cytophagales bacterium]